MKYIIVTILVGFVCVLMVNFVFAQTDFQKNASLNLSKTGYEADYTPSPTATVLAEKGITIKIANLIKYALGIIGTLTVLFIIYGGFQWITARGNAEQAGSAQKTVVNATIGLIVVTLSYLIISLALTFGSTAS